MANNTRELPKELNLPLRLPLVGAPNQRGATPGQDSKLVNAYVERTDDGEIHIVKRPGLTEKFSLGGGYYGMGMVGEKAFWARFTEAPGITYDLYAGTSPLSTTFGSHAIGSLGDTTQLRHFYADVVPVGVESGTTFFHNRFAAWTWDTTEQLIPIPFFGTALTGVAATTTSGDDEVTVASTAGIRKYSTLTGVNIPPGVYVTDIVNSVTFEMSDNASGSGATTLAFSLAGPYVSGSLYSPIFQLVAGVLDLNTAVYLFARNSYLSASDPADPYAWNQLARGLAYANQDDPMRITKHLSYIVAFKSETTEVFRDAGTSPWPLTPVEGMRLQVGLYGYRTMAEADGALFWVSKTTTGLKSVWIMQDGKVREIASPTVRRALEALDPQYAIAFSVSGHTFFIFTDPTAGVSLAYDKASDLWSYWEGLGLTYWPFVAAAFVDGEVHLQQETNGMIYRLDPEAVEDDGQTIQMDIIPPEFDGSMRVEKFLSKMYVIADQEYESRLFLRVNDQNGRDGHWSPWREFDLSQDRPRLDDCGSFVKRQFHFRHSDPTRCRLRAVELDLWPGVL